MPAGAYPSPFSQVGADDRWLPWVVFNAEVLTSALPHIERRCFRPGELSRETVGRLGEHVLAADAGAVPIGFVLRLAGGPVALIGIGRDGRAEAAVAADDSEVACREARRIAHALDAPPPEPPEDNVALVFWSRAPHGPRPVRRIVSAPGWAQIAGNYGRECVEQLRRLVAYDSAKGGGLVLLQGPPGTGKTTLLRALARAWRPWCDFHVVVDPEVILGTDSSYLLDVLLGGGEGPGARVLVLEDAGELLAEDARPAVGQALSRLLNVSDGLLGQGLELLTIVTTNEPIEHLHPAVTRPGRCRASVTIGPLEVGEANDWLRNRGLPGDVEEPECLRFARRSSPLSIPRGRYAPQPDAVQLYSSASVTSPTASGEPRCGCVGASQNQSLEA